MAVLRFAATLDESQGDDVLGGGRTTVPARRWGSSWARRRAGLRWGKVGASAWGGGVWAVWLARRGG